MKIKKLTFLLASFIIFLSSCVTPKDTNLLQDIKKDYPEAQNLINSDYRIITGDQLKLGIYTLDEDMKTLFAPFIKQPGTATTTQGGSTSVQTGGNYANARDVLNVYSDGTVNIPYLGKVYVEDLTILEAKKVIESRFKEFSPNISIDLNLNNRYFTILGQAAQGRYVMPSTKITIFQALAMSGPIQTFGDRTRVKIVRQTPNGTEVKMFDIRSKDVVNSEYYYIQPNDVIYVSQMSRTFFGRVTSFTGALGLFGLVTTTVAAVVVVVNLVK